MKPHPLRIVHAPLHGATATRGEIWNALSLDPCSIAFTEGSPLRIFPYLVSRPNFPAVVGHKHMTERRLRGAHDTPILRRRHHKKVDQFAYMACEASWPRKIAPPRWNTGHAYKHEWGTIGHIAAHPNAVVVGRDPAKVDRVAKYVEQMAKLEASIRQWQRLGYLIVVTGDFNHPAGGPRWAPEPMFERLGLHSWNYHIDWIAWDKRLALPKANREVIHDNGQDHPWMVATFRLAGG